jgi:hypothetical protein
MEELKDHLRKMRIGLLNSISVNHDEPKEGAPYFREQIKLTQQKIKDYDGTTN